ncbi:hypothetical protein AB1N83_001326 [Pleurotus pulmonarius]
MPQSVSNAQLPNGTRPRTNSAPFKKGRKLVFDGILMPPLKAERTRSGGGVLAESPFPQPLPEPLTNGPHAVSHGATSHIALRDTSDDIDTKSHRSSESSSSKGHRNLVSNATAVAGGAPQVVSSSKKATAPKPSSRKGSPSSVSTLKGSNGRKRNPSPGESTETEVVSLSASASTSSAKSAATETPKNATKANRTATKKRQRLLIDAATGEPKSTVASTRDPFDDDEGDVIMSDARDEPFEDDFEIDFQMLRLDEVTTPAWVPAGTAAPAMYVPPGAQELITSMKRSLDNVEKARRKLEERYLQEMHKRIALENELARLRRCITLGSVGLKTTPPEAL